MFRLLSILLVVLGLGAVVYGGMRYLNVTYPLADVPQQAASAPSRSLAPSLGGDDDMFSITAVTDNPLEGLQTVPIAHETPNRAKFGLPFDVTVAIDATGDDTAVDALPGTGNIVEGTAQVSATVMAALSGETFMIEAVTPTTQTVSPLTENVWRWRVTPTETGAHDLVVELFALSETGAAMPVRTFRDKVEVQVSRVGQVISVVDSFSPIAVVIGGIGSLLGGLFGAIRLFRKR